MPLFYNPNSWRYISDLSKVGARVTSPRSDDYLDEDAPANSVFDFIIVGGGRFSEL
jgi:hypothetical protein